MINDSNVKYYAYEENIGIINSIYFFEVILGQINEIIVMSNNNRIDDEDDWIDYKKLEIEKVDIFDVNNGILPSESKEVDFYIYNRVKSYMNDPYTAANFKTYNPKYADLRDSNDMMYYDFKQNWAEEFGIDENSEDIPDIESREYEAWCNREYNLGHYQRKWIPKKYYPISYFRTISELI